MVSLVLIPLLVTGVIEIRDGWSGEAVVAEVRVRTGEGIVHLRGSLLHLPALAETVEVDHPRYLPLRVPLSGLPSRVEIWLTPRQPPRLPPPVPGMLTIGGVVVDEMGVPLPGAQLTLSGSTGYTDAGGRFALSIPAREIPAPHPTLWPRETIRVEAPGYITQLREIHPIEGVLWLKIRMEEGSGVRVVREIHGKGTGPPEPAVSPPASPPGKQPVWLPPPPLIRVGQDCSGRTCTRVVILSLELYVASGLDEEWIASWPAHALRAGAVAYRTYGAWHTAHPIAPDYDICNTTACQVWDGSDIYLTVMDAVRHTRGILLAKGTTFAFTEYAAENNDCGCGDGWAGTGDSWPCIPDSVDAGFPCYGHGRGMCQWGTSRWADRGKTWVWMTRHYYEPGGYTLSTPLTFREVFHTPDTLRPGDTLELTFVLEGWMEDTLPHGMLGASLYHTVYGYVSDPLHDAPVVFLPGVQSLHRILVVPPDLPAGTWEILWGLWLDVNEDGRIQPGDLPLGLLRRGRVVVAPSLTVPEHHADRPRIRVIVRPTGEVFLWGDVPIEGVIVDVQGRVVRRVTLAPSHPYRTVLPRGVYGLILGSTRQRLWIP